jgi:predicted ATPase
MRARADRGWTGLVERDAERGLIEAALAGAELGRGRMVLLYGQSGIGRSSLLDASVGDAG